MMMDEDKKKQFENAVEDILRHDKDPEIAYNKLEVLNLLAMMEELGPTWMECLLYHAINLARLKVGEYTVLTKQQINEIEDKYCSQFKGYYSRLTYKGERVISRCMQTDDWRYYIAIRYNENNKKYIVVRVKDEMECKELVERKDSILEALRQYKEIS